MSDLVGFESWALLAGDSPTSRTEWAAVVAAWSEPHRRYHDVAYDPERTDNEQVSAARARAGLRGLVPDARVDEVERLVLLTAAHDPDPDDANGAVLCDADLAVLAGPPDAYATYASAVREEYGRLSDEEFTAGRIAVLEHLLALPELYRTEAARPWTDRARANLTAELTLLRRRARPS